MTAPRSVSCQIRLTQTLGGGGMKGCTYRMRSWEMIESAILFNEVKVPLVLGIDTVNESNL